MTRSPVDGGRRGHLMAGDLRMAFTSWPGQGPPIVALHGITASSASFIGIATRLGGRRPLIALDLRGRGDSAKPDGPYGMETHAADVAAAMSALGLEPSVVVGHSMGAFVAAALAAGHPEVTTGVVFVDGGLPLDPPPGIPLEDLLEAALSMQVGRLRRTFASHGEYLDFWKAQPPFVGDRWNEWVEHYLRCDLRAAGDRYQPKASEAAVRADALETADVEGIRRRLRAIRVPVLMLRAPEGFNPGDPPLFPDELVTRESGDIADFEEWVVPGTTHYTIGLGDDGARAVANALVEFAQERGC